MNIHVLSEEGESIKDVITFFMWTCLFMSISYFIKYQPGNQQVSWLDNDIVTSIQCGQTGTSTNRLWSQTGTYNEQWRKTIG